MKYLFHNKKLVNNSNMRVLRISKFFDFLFGTAFLFLICFVWTRYFVHDVWKTIAISAIVTFFIISVYHIIKNKKESRKQLTEQEIKNAKKISTNFLLKTKQEILKEFEKNLSKKYQTKIKSDYLIINNNILRPIFSSAVITDKEVIESYTKTKSLSAEKLIIVCKNANVEAKKIANMIDGQKVIVLEEIEAYDDIYKPLNFSVPDKMQDTKKRKKAYDYLSFALNKARTKNYLIVAVFLLFSSFLLRYNIYYIIFASITTLLALYSHFNTRFNLPQKSKIE